jgi:hypothetical protein
VSQSAGLPGLGSDVSSSKPKVSFAFIALGFIIILCAALRFYHIGAASLWTDEIISRYYAQVFDLHYQFTAGLLAEPTPPTYALLLRAWMALFGYSEAAMRSLSTLACLLCVPVIYLLGRELAGKWQGLLAALLFALCPTSLYFGQEARVYALFTLSASIVLWAVAVLLRDPRSVKAAVGYVLFATLCLYLHATGLLFIIACAGAVGLFWLTQGAPGRRQLLKWTALNVLVLLLAAPYLFYTILASRDTTSMARYFLSGCAARNAGHLAVPPPSLYASKCHSSRRAFPFCFVRSRVKSSSSDLVAANPRLDCRAPLSDCRKSAFGGWTCAFCRPDLLSGHVRNRLVLSGDNAGQRKGALARSCARICTRA